MRAAGQLGDQPHQFPADPWVLWEGRRIFRLLKSPNFDSAAVERLRDLSIEQLMDMSPAALLALMGAPHRALRLPSWGVALLAGLAAGTTALVAYREWRSQQGGEPWRG